MVKTEASRWMVTDESGIRLPDDVRRVLNEWNKTHNIKLDILWSAPKWQIYRIKKFGATTNEDILHWQMAAPTEGTNITPGILDWLRKYDTSNNGYLDREEITKNWLETWKRGKEKIDKRNQVEADDRAYGHKDLILGKLGTLREQISVPITVGFNKKTGRKVLAVKKKCYV